MGNTIVYNGEIKDLETMTIEELENFEATLLETYERKTNELNKKLHIDDEIDER